MRTIKLPDISSIGALSFGNFGQSHQ